MKWDSGMMRAYTVLLDTAMRMVSAQIKNLSEAVYWYSKAEECGSDEGREELNKLLGIEDELHSHMKPFMYE